MKKFSKVEKVLIATNEGEFNTYKCPEHGVFQKRKAIDNGECIFCKKKCEPIENIDELKEKFRIELGLNDKK